MIQNNYFKETKRATKENRQLNDIRKSIYKQNDKFNKELKIILK